MTKWDKGLFLKKIKNECDPRVQTIIDDIVNKMEDASIALVDLLGNNKK